MEKSDSDKKNLVEFIRKSSRIFQGLDYAELQEVVAQARTTQYNKGDTVVAAGDESTALYLILRGRCKVSIPFDFNLGENVLTHLKEGEIFGEMGVITGNARTADVKCVTDTELMVISGSDFWSIANKYPVILKNIIQSLSDRIVALNRGKKAEHAGLNLSDAQRSHLTDFRDFVNACGHILVDRSVNARPAPRNFKKTPFSFFKMLLYRLHVFIIDLFVSPYIHKIEGFQNIPAGRPVIFLINFRTWFDFLFLYAALRKADPTRVLSFALNVTTFGKKRFQFFRGLFSALLGTFIYKDFKDPLKGSEDATNMLNAAGAAGTRRMIVDTAFHPFPRKSMRYDVLMEHHHFNIWLKTGQNRDIIPVAITGTDKFWPFEPWDRKFFDLSALLNFRSVDIKIGKAMTPGGEGFAQKIDECASDVQSGALKIIGLFDVANEPIGAAIAALEGRIYAPVRRGIEVGALRAFNEKWANRLSLLLPSGLTLRKKHGRRSVKVRHFIWHAQYLNVLLEHLEHEGFLLPEWAKGMLVGGAAHADVRWPFFSMDHSYNPFTKKGMKLVVRFPSLISTLKRELKALLKTVGGAPGVNGGMTPGVRERDFNVEKFLTRLGRIYHLMTDLAVPAHVHNIPHMFIDLPRIGKCDFEEFLGLDNQLFELGGVDIGDISSYEVNSFDEFYKRLDDIAKYTFLNSCFTAEGLGDIAADRMVFGCDNVEELIEKMKKVGVEIIPVEGYSQEKRYYVRNLTSLHCENISIKTTYFSLKMIAPCFLFLIGQVSGRFRERFGEDACKGRVG